MTWIKICGTTNLEDAQMCIEAGADALGFIFAESPRRITPKTAAEIIAKTVANIEKIGVFKNESIRCLIETAKIAGLTSVQLHGTESAEYIEELISKSSVKVIQVLPKHIASIEPKSADGFDIA